MCGERRASLPSAEKWRTALFNLAPLFAAIAYGVFYAVRTRTLFVSRDISTGRPCERRDPYGEESRFGTGAEAFFSLLRPGVMGPCVRRDDPLRGCARPRSHQRAAQFTHMRFPCPPGEGKKER